MTPSKRRKMQSQQQKSDLFNCEASEHMSCFTAEAWAKLVKERGLEGLIKRVNSERTSLLEKTEIEAASTYGVLVTDLLVITQFMKLYRTGYGKKHDEALVADLLSSLTDLLAVT